MEQKNYTGVLKLTFSSFSESGIREEIGTERYRTKAYRDGDTTYLNWDMADGSMGMELRADRVVVLREGDDVNYRMELEFAKETLMELNTPHGVLRFTVLTTELAWDQSSDFPEQGCLDLLLVYDLFDRGQKVSTRMMSGKMKPEA